MITGMTIIGKKAPGLIMYKDRIYTRWTKK